jgi:hypothetical protein
VDTLEHGISKLPVIQAEAVAVVQIHPLTVADYGYSVALVLQDKDFQVVQECVSTMTEKTHTMAEVVVVLAALAGPAKTKINKLPLMAVLVQPAIS